MESRIRITAVAEPSMLIELDKNVKTMRSLSCRSSFESKYDTAPIWPSLSPIKYSRLRLNFGVAVLRY